MRPVALLTDFGLADHYVGVLHAVLERDAPGLARIDLGHGVDPGDIWDASFQLRCAWPDLPDDCVVMAVVDPGVGTSRRVVALAVGDRFLVAPDNGLAAAVGPTATVVTLDWRRMGLDEPSPTFHGRDLFAPAAARLAAGADLLSLGEDVAVDTLLPCPLPEPNQGASGIDAVILHVDRFGNLVTSVRTVNHPDVTMATFAGRMARRVRTYAEAQPDEVVLLEGSAGYLELAVNCGSAAEATGLERGDTVVFSD
jgi:hypothetical protein